MATTYARFPGSRFEHVIADGKTTRCGLDATLAARFTDAERGSDAKSRPLCSGCRKTSLYGEVVCERCGGVGPNACVCDIAPLKKEEN